MRATELQQPPFWAREIFREGSRNVAAGSNPTAVRRGIEKAVAAAVGRLLEMAKKVERPEEVAQVGAISANNDRSIGDLLAKALQKVGKDGVITVEEGKTTETTVRFVDGMQFDKGFVSPYFINRTAEMDCLLEDALILIHEKKISNLRELLPLLEKVAQSGKPLLIIAEDIDGDALTALVVNKLRGVLNICASKAPGFGDRRKSMLADIATLTGGTLVSEDLGLKLENLDLSHLGKAKKITIDKSETTIVQGLESLPTFRLGCNRFAIRSTQLKVNTIARSSKNGLQNLPVVWPSFQLVPARKLK